MRLAMMIIGTLLAVFLIIKYIKGKKYADLIEGLEDDNEYPLKDLYVIGFSMNDNSIFKIHDKNKYELISQAKLLYDSRYSEYYAMIAWAQTLTFAYLGVVFGFAISFFVFFLMSILTKSGIGMGDVKLVSAMGCLIGLSGTFFSVFYGMVVCMFMAIGFIAFKKRKVKDKIAFAPFIYIGYLITMLLGTF